VVRDAEDHHAHEPEQVRMHMGGAVHDRLWLERHPDSEYHPAAKPQETRPDEVPDERLHQWLIPATAACPTWIRPTAPLLASANAGVTNAYTPSPLSPALNSASNTAPPPAGTV